MATYTCRRCRKSNPHGVYSGMCSPCLTELESLQEGDAVVWVDRRTPPRAHPATFLRRMRFSFAIRSPQGGTLYRESWRIHRTPPGFVTDPG